MLDLKQWTQWLEQPQCKLKINADWIGYSRRTDQWSCSNRSISSHMLWLIHEGEVEGGSNGQSFKLKPGDFFWHYPDIPLDMQWPSTLAFTEILLKLEADDDKIEWPDETLIIPHAWDADQWMGHLADEIRFPRLHSPERIHQFLLLLISELNRLQSHKHSNTQALSQNQLRQIERYFGDRITERPSVDDLAYHAGLSTDYFSRKFKASTGRSPRTWMVEQRIRAASQMLRESNISIAAVADQLGYANVSQFSRQFKEITGQTPLEWRQRTLP